MTAFHSLSRWHFRMLSNRRHFAVFVLAAIGDPDGDTGPTAVGHALLLVPLDIEPDNGNASTGASSSSSDGSNQFDTNQDIGPAPGQGNIGDKVLSYLIRYPKRGVKPQQHFVSPKSTLPGPLVEYVVFKSGIPPGLTSCFEWIPGDGIVIKPNSDSGTDVQVRRDSSNHIKLQLLNKFTNTPVDDVMNVWIVWAEGGMVNGDPSEPPVPKGALGYNQTFTKNGLSAAFSQTLDTFRKCKFQISPSELFELNEDVPDLTGTKDKDGDPEIDGKDHNYGYSLASGAIMRWDISRRISVHFENPARIPLDQLPYVPGDLYTAIGGAAEADLPFPSPSPSIIGNDDFIFAQTSADERVENSQPYAVYNAEPLLSHGIGEVTSVDKPNLVMTTTPSKAAEFTWTEHATYEDFVRLQIGKQWYVVSDDAPWEMIFEIKVKNGVVSDIGCDPGNKEEFRDGIGD